MSSLLNYNPFASTVNGLLVDLAAPCNLSYGWNFGSLLGVCLVVQLLSGVWLSFHYSSSVLFAFDSVEHIMSDVWAGWWLSYVHANGASLFFICVYLHVASGLYFGSYSSPSGPVWSFGVFILLIMMATAFLGYVLPWGQMSFWGATVITSMLSAVPFFGNDLVHWIWGGFSVDYPTLSSFYSFHFLLPFVLISLVLLHIISLHLEGSNNPLGTSSYVDNVPFHFYFSSKDILGFLFLFSFFCFLVSFYPNFLGHSDNYTEADPLVTPTHIQPEWYFLPFYAILSAIPDNLLGVLAMVFSICILFIFPVLNLHMSSSCSLNISSSLNFWFLINCLVILTVLGSRPAEYPFNILSQIFSILYFSSCIISLFSLNSLFFIPLGSPEERSRP